MLATSGTVHLLGYACSTLVIVRIRTNLVLLSSVLSSVSSEEIIKPFAN